VKRAPRKPNQNRSAGVNSNPSRSEQAEFTAGEGANASGASSSPPAAHESPNAVKVFGTKRSWAVAPSSEAYAIKRQKNQEARDDALTRVPFARPKRKT
jgi:hypothetical protein